MDTAIIIEKGIFIFAIFAITMLMAMYSHPVGENSQFGFRVMGSLDPIIEQGFGYPLLYQSRNFIIPKT